MCLLFESNLTSSRARIHLTFQVFLFQIWIQSVFGIYCRNQASCYVRILLACGIFWTSTVPSSVIFFRYGHQSIICLSRLHPERTTPLYCFQGFGIPSTGMNSVVVRRLDELHVFGGTRWHRSCTKYGCDCSWRWAALLLVFQLPFDMKFAASPCWILWNAYVRLNASLAHLWPIAAFWRYWILLSSLEQHFSPCSVHFIISPCCLYNALAGAQALVINLLTLRLRSAVILIFSRNWVPFFIHHCNGLGKMKIFSFNISHFVCLGNSAK